MQYEIETLEKIQTYMDLIEIFVQALDLTRKGKKTVPALGHKLSKVGLKLSIIASDDVFKKYLYWRAISMAGEEPQKMIDAFGEILLKMREDLQGKILITLADILDAFG